MDATFSTSYLTSTGFLSGQSLISKITAIQIIQDQSGLWINPQVLAVFGLGSDGVTPYVGYAVMDLYAQPLTPIVVTSVSFFPFKFG
jgi:hypothetical protein